MILTVINAEKQKAEFSEIPACPSGTIKAFLWIYMRTMKIKRTKFAARFSGFHGIIRRHCGTIMDTPAHTCTYDEGLSQVKWFSCLHVLHGKKNLLCQNMRKFSAADISKKEFVHHKLRTFLRRRRWHMNNSSEETVDGKILQLFMKYK